MNLRYEFRTLDEWPGIKTPCRIYARFKAPFSRTEDQLARELEHLAAKNIVIQADCDRSQIRMDGTLRADAKMRSPAIILSFDSTHGHLSYPCDTHTTWQDNLRANAMALEALRTIDRYGVTRRGEQYKGWDALPEPDPMAIILKYAPGVSDVKNAVREAKRKTHPDMGGNQDEFCAVSEAAKRLGL